MRSETRNSIRIHNQGTAHSAFRAPASARSMSLNRAAFTPWYLIAVSASSLCLSVAAANASGKHNHACGHCLDLAEHSVMFVETLRDEVKAQIRSADSGSAAARFQLQDSRWTSTATHPSISQGEGFFITYSFVLDGTSIPATLWDTNPGAEPSNLIGSMNTLFPTGMDGFRAEVREMFDAWERVTNIRFIEVPDDGAPFVAANTGILPSDTRIGRGDIRIAMRNIDGAGVDTDGDGTIDRNVGAYNGYPAAGSDMVLDSGDMSLWLNAANDFRGLKNATGHEVGHGLGIMHVMPLDSTKLMEPNVAATFDGPQEDDIRAVARIYGDFVEPNDTFDSATPIGSIGLGASAQIQTNFELSLERQSAVDYFKFSATAGIGFQVRVVPIGTSYQQGPQPPAFPPGIPVVLNTVNAAAVRDLRLTVYHGQTAIGLADQNPAGLPETVNVEDAPGSGVYTIRVSSNDQVDQPQRYQLIITRDDQPDIRLVAQTNPPEEVESDGVFVFGSANQDTSIHRNFRIANEGAGTLLFTNNPHVTIFGTNPDDFFVNVQPSQSTLEPGEETEINIGFQPTAFGIRTATILISSNDPDEGAFAFTVMGSGLATTTSAPVGEPEIRVFQVTPAYVFGKVEVQDGGLSEVPDVEVGDDAFVFYFIENHGDSDLVLSGDVVIDQGATDFSILSQTTGFPIPAGNPAGNAADFRIRFSPSDTGTQTATIYINSNAPGAAGQFAFTLRGRGSETIEDCNGNGEADEDDIADGVSADCDANDLPDECDADSDGDGVPDACDLCDGQDDLSDADGDGTIDCLDGCPNDPFKLEPGNCGCDREETEDCGIDSCSDSDDDGDGVCNSLDQCPGQDDLRDSDFDGTVDCLDGCPNDPFKTVPGNCGCNQGETDDCVTDPCPDGDDDGDGVCNSEDACPGQDDLLDSDGDGTVDCLESDDGSGETQNGDNGVGQDGGEQDESGVPVSPPDDDGPPECSNTGPCGAGCAVPMMMGLLMIGQGRNRRRRNGLS